MHEVQAQNHSTASDGLPATNAGAALVAVDARVLWSDRQFVRTLADPLAPCRLSEGLLCPGGGVPVWGDWVRLARMGEDRALPLASLPSERWYAVVHRVQGGLRVGLHVSRRCDLRARLLQDCFGLTEAEAHVGRLLALGQGIDDIARVRRVQANTVQVQIKRAMEKAGVHRQAELVSLMWRSPAPIVADPAHPQFAGERVERYPSGE